MGVFEGIYLVGSFVSAVVAASQSIASYRDGIREGWLIFPARTIVWGLCFALVAAALSWLAVGYFLVESKAAARS